MNNFNVKDFSVSNEVFELVYDKELDMLVTTPQPLEENLAKYYQTEDYISHTDSKRNLLEKVYHLVRNYSLKRKLKLINKYPGQNRLLDVGCGTGDFLKVAKDSGWTVSGIEPNEQARTIANNKTDQSVFNINQLLEFEEKSFDVITLWHVLEHLPKLENHIMVFKRLLSDNGKLIIAVPNFKSYDAKYYKEFWAAYDVPRHLWHFSKTAIQKLFYKYEFSLVKILPMKFDAYYVSLLSEKYKNGKMKPVSAFYTGFRSNWNAKTTKEHSSLIYILKKD